MIDCPIILINFFLYFKCFPEKEIEMVWKLDVLCLLFQVNNTENRIFLLFLLPFQINFNYSLLKIFCKIIFQKNIQRSMPK